MFSVIYTRKKRAGKENDLRCVWWISCGCCGHGSFHALKRNEIVQNATNRTLTVKRVQIKTNQSTLNIKFQLRTSHIYFSNEEENHIIWFEFTLKHSRAPVRFADAIIEKAAKRYFCILCKVAKRRGEKPDRNINSSLCALCVEYANYCRDQSLKVAAVK